VNKDIAIRLDLLHVVRPHIDPISNNLASSTEAERIITASELAQHNAEQSVRVVINSTVYECVPIKFCAYFVW
jgi:hypothetical protein